MTKRPIDHLEKGNVALMEMLPDDGPEYKCVKGHDLCHTMYPCEECPYCELKKPMPRQRQRLNKTNNVGGPMSKNRIFDLSDELDVVTKGFTCPRCSQNYTAPVQTVVEPETFEHICQQCFTKSPYYDCI